MKIVTVAAGLGSRLSANFIDVEKNNVRKFSKALHPVLGRPMVWWSVNSFKHWLTLGEIKYDDLIFVIQSSHDSEFNMSKELYFSFKPNIKVEKVDELTRGPAETALRGIIQVNEYEEMIVNDCDHHFSSDSLLSLIKLFREEKRGQDFLIISTVKTEPGIASWSYVETEELHENLLAIKQCSDLGIKINATCVSSFMQAKMCSLSGAKIVSFFWGKMYDQGINPSDHVMNFRLWIDKNFQQNKPDLLVGSVRQIGSIESAFLSGADIVTTSWANFQKIGNQFVADQSNAAFQESF